MDITVDFISRNLVTHTNFVKFRDIQNFTFFEATSVKCHKASNLSQGMEMENASFTHDLPCVTRHAKANTSVTHGKPCVHMHANGYAYKMGSQFVEEGRNSKERRRKKKRERKEINKERKKEKKWRERVRKGNLSSDGRNSSDQEVKSEG